MSSVANSAPEPSFTEEAEIFKSLAHEIRRNIIKSLGKKDRSSFTDIKNATGDIDSPTLSYHLKSLKSLVEQQSGEYFLTDIGKIALLLMHRIDQSEIIKAGRKKFLYANIVTQISWIIIMVLIPILISPYAGIPLPVLIWVSVLLNGAGQLNFQVVWRLYGKPPDLSRYFKIEPAVKGTQIGKGDSK